MPADVDTAQLAANPQTVPVNLFEADAGLVLVCPLPGVMADDVEVEVRSGSVRVTAAMRTPAEKRYLLHEWHYGPYERTVEIPPGFGGDVLATFGNGQLAVSIGRGEGAETRRVKPSTA